MGIEEDVGQLLEKAEQALVSDDLAAARSCYRDVLRAVPAHPLATRAIAEVERELGAWFAPERKVSLLVNLRELVSGTVAPREALVISRLASGDLTVRRLGEEAQMEASDLHEVLFRGIAAGILRLA